MPPRNPLRLFGVLGVMRPNDLLGVDGADLLVGCRKSVLGIQDGVMITSYLYACNDANQTACACGHKTDAIVSYSVTVTTSYCTFIIYYTTCTWY